MKRDSYYIIPLLLLISVTANTQSRIKSIFFPVVTAQQQIQMWEFFDANNILCTINSEGPFADYLRTNSAGFLWPKGSNKTAIYTAGIWIAGIHRPTGAIRTAVQDYQTEYRSGSIEGIFNTTTNDQSVAANPDDVRYRIYKINKNDPDTRKDYQEWPGDLGAPFIDVNGNGTWEKGIDTPKITGAQTLWSVYNDADTIRHMNAGRTEPMGLEVQATYFGFNDILFTKDVMFLKWKIINKSDAYYDGTYFGLWSDTDLGDGNDDCVGVDTMRWLCYTYNGDSVDGSAAGYDRTPPAVGFVYLQTPKVSSENDSAYFNGQWHLGFRNVAVHAFVPFFPSPGEPVNITPPSLRAIRSLQGLIESTGQPFVNPKTGETTTFVFSGDPLTDSGWTQRNHPMDPFDIRSLFSTGPFTFAPGDTQEVVAAIVMGQGTDHLKSITKLRLNADLVRELFYSGFTLYDIEQPPPPQPPVPQKFTLSQNYPNPFNPKTTFTYSVPQFDVPYRVKIQIFDLLGREAATLVHEHKPGGTYSVDWNASDHPSGVYYCRLTLGGLVETKKMMLLR